MPELSVIIPVYNVESYLERCVNSVRRQTWKDLEIILVDDGSEDGSGKICDEFARRDRRIVTVHQMNQGPSAARNAGLKLALGRYVGFIDGDDWVREEYYEHLMGLARKEKADIATCLYERAAEEKDSYRAFPFERVKALNGEEMLQYFLASAIKGGVTYVPCWSKVYRRDAIAHCRFHTEIQYSEDLLFNWEALCSVRKCVYSDCKAYFYFQNEKSITASKRKDGEKAIRDLFHVAEKMAQVYQGDSKKTLDLLRQYRAKVHFSVFIKFGDAREPDALELLLKNVKREGKRLMDSPLSISRKLFLLFVLAAPKKMLLKMMYLKK